MDVGKFTVKGVVEGRGHDGGGLIADVYLNNKKVLTYHDDGWGGEAEYHFISKSTQAQVLAEMKRIDVNGDMMSKGWDKFDRTEVQEHYQIGHLIDACIEAKIRKKDEKKGVCYTKADGTTMINSWGNVTLPTLIKKYNLAQVQRVVLESITKIEKRGDTVTNMDYLKSINVYQ